MQRHIQAMMQRAGGMSRLWTPADATPRLWFDAADSSTITLVDNKVSAWADKSTNATHAGQPTSTYRCTVTSNAIGGLPALTFNGTTQFMSFTELSVDDNNTAIFSVFSRASASIHSADVGGPNITYGYGQLWFTDNVLYASLRLSAYTTHGSASTATGSFFSSIVRTNSGTTAWRNGSLLGSANQGAAATGVTPFSTIARAQAYYHNGHIGEIVMLRAAVDTDLRNKMEGYLAHKWGLAGNLPNDHPYKSAAPRA